MYMHEHAMFVNSPERVLEIVKSSGPQEKIDKGFNTTTIPDDLLLKPGTIPVITIRNPILYVPSNHRAVNRLYTGATRCNSLSNSNLASSRDLYNYYKSHGIEPIVVDADDYMTSETFVKHLTSKIGLDPEKAVTSWPKCSEKEKQAMHPMLLAVQSTLVNSEGLRGDRAAKNIDLAAEMEKWKEEFGNEEVDLLEELVEIARPHYEYLWDRRLRLKT